jgi:hypothetical protein
MGSQPHLLQHIQDAIVPGTTTMTNQHAAGPAFINDNDDFPVAPPPCAAWMARMHAQHCTEQQVHLINLVITEALMPMIDMKPATLFPAHGYVAATCALLENTYGVVQPANSPVMLDSNNFIGAIADNITGDVCEYCHLIKSNTHCSIWQKSFATNSAAFSKAYAISKTWTPASSSTRIKCLVTKGQRTVAFVVIIGHKKMNSIAHNSLLAATASHTPATTALPPPTLSLQSSSSIQQF